MTSMLLETISRRRAWWTLCGLLLPATLLMALDRSIVTIAAPTLQEHYDLTLPQLGLIFSVFNWTYAVMQIPAGAFVSRFGPRIAIMMAVVLWSAMTAITPFAGSFAALLVVRVFLAIGQSPDWPGSIASIDRLFPSQERAVANGLLLFALYVGVALGAPLGSHLLMVIGLEGLFLVCGATGIVIAGIWWSYFREPPCRVDAESTRGSRMPLRQMAKSSRVWTLAGTYACAIGSLNIYLSLFPTYLAKARGMDLARMGNYAAVSSSALCVAALTAGPVLAFVFARTSSVRAARLPFGIGSLAIVAIASLMVPWLKSDLTILLAASVSLAGIGFANVTIWSVVQDIGRNDTATLTGFVQLAGNLAAGTFPLLAALLVTYYDSWNSSFLLLAAGAVIGCILWLFIDPGRPLGDEPKNREADLGN